MYINDLLCSITIKIICNNYKYRYYLRRLEAEMNSSVDIRTSTWRRENEQLIDHRGVRYERNVSKICTDIYMI